ncbi:transcriptional regulator with XRE-family HTH domain [Mesorhizobium soli]|uniref:Transcriptional regulator n=1 Tax=Pseudaminobacter soli (ex Li et al. 2025) TaxID=1295366 RepID=A0A2P7S0F8_9HYPH|nr:helix-turn-helix transcriptional regulator [Mesorhizobium soli]MDH6230782.1 transcriptional regulator with XRE-family HTH domain [Mesorhizobium soli]PSJ55951.1 transcriptional regulator [Mesorhizobium soli]
MVETLGTDRHKALIALLIKKREAAGLTQNELATRLGQYQSFVARLESGQRRVDVVEFMKLAEILGFDASSAIKKLSEVTD